MPLDEDRRIDIQPIVAGHTEFLVEVIDTGGPGVIGRDVEEPLDFRDIRETIEEIARELGEVWNRVKPAEATVEFGLSVTAKNGRLTGLLVEGSATGSLKITLTWKDGSGK